MTGKFPDGVQINASMHPRFDEILTPQALAFVAKLHRAFDGRRKELLKARAERQARIDAGEMPDFLPETKSIRDGDWKIAPLPKALECRRVEITGPVERKMIINAFNSGADSYMADFEDSNSPNWFNQINGQVNLKDAIRREISFTNEAGKVYKLNDTIATLQIRPRGWHLDEKHVTVDGQRVSGGIFDFALSFFHNAKEQVKRGAGPFFYLPKMENHREARLWNDIFVMAQNEIGLPQGTIKATVLIETILATFEMEEILYELREHSAGLNAGRWDYIFSAIKKFRNKPGFCLANRVAINMEVPFMRSYALALVQACHKRGAPAIGGMAALIPIKNDAAANEKALAGVRHDKKRDANDGFDGGWIAHPGLVQIAMEEFKRVLGDKPNQWSKQRDEKFKARRFPEFRTGTTDHRNGIAQQHQRRHPLSRQLARGQRLRADSQSHGRCGDGRDFALASVAMGRQRQRQTRRRPKSRRGAGALADSGRTPKREEGRRRARRTAWHVRSGGGDLREDGAGEGLPGISYAAAVRGDGVTANYFDSKS